MFLYMFYIIKKKCNVQQASQFITNIIFSPWKVTWEIRVALFFFRKRKWRRVSTRCGRRKIWFMLYIRFTPPVTVSGCHISATTITWIDAGRPRDNTRSLIFLWSQLKVIEQPPGGQADSTRFTTVASLLSRSGVTLCMVIFFHPSVCKMSEIKPSV